MKKKLSSNNFFSQASGGCCLPCNAVCFYAVDCGNTSRITTKHLNMSGEETIAVHHVSTSEITKLKFSTLKHCKLVKNSNSM